MKLSGTLILLSLSLPTIAADPATLDQLPARIGSAEIHLIFADGTTQWSHLKGTQLANGGTLKIGTWRTKVLACREVKTISYQPVSRSLARGAVGTAVALGFAWAVIRAPAPIDQASFPLVLTSPLAGIYGAHRLIPRRLQTVSVVCP